MRTLGVICLLVVALIGAVAAKKSYAGYQVFRTGKLDLEGLENLAPLYRNPAFDFWTEPRQGRSVDIMTSPEHVTMLKNELTRFGLEPELLVPDVGVTVGKERAQIEAMKETEKLFGRAPDLTRFLEFNEIEAYLDSVVAAFPSIASISTIGTSHEGRPLRVLKLSNGPGKSGMFMDAAIHAREWMGPPVILHTINQLTENLANNKAMLDAHDFYFLPVTNPDGYVFSWDDTRLWRKTRRPNSGSSCVGTDANRNFDWNWAGGGIPSPCDDTFPGSGPFSEVEAKAVADFLTANQKITFYVTIHSFGEYLLYPWGDTNEIAPNTFNLDRVGKAAMNALSAVSGTFYEVGSIINVLYAAYGGSIDWTLGVLDLMYSYAIELPGGGILGFNPPPEDIVPVTTETWEAIKVFAANIPDARG